MARPVGTTIGEQLRDWRTRRHLSQLDLAGLAGVSARHLSFVETGRSRPSREMVLHLAEHLDVPLRARNALLLAAGFAPVYRSTDLGAPEMEPVRHALDTVLAGHSPYPAVVVDQAWELLAANPAVGMFLDGVAEDLLAPPVNVLRVTLHPDGMAKRIVNLPEWSHHLLARLKRQWLITGDTSLMELHRPARSPSRCSSASHRRRTGATRRCRSSRPSPRSAPPSTSRWPSWPSSRSSRPTRRRPPRSGGCRPSRCPPDVRPQSGCFEKRPSTVVVVPTELSPAIWSSRSSPPNALMSCLGSASMV
jgi:transcriptional regulator with XRE-family HTH domain